MDTVGIRELKAHLSRHLKRVRSGSRLLVTERGRVVADAGITVTRCRCRTRTAASYLGASGERLVDKDEAADLTPTQKAHLRTAIEMERKTRQARRSARRRR